MTTAVDVTAFEGAQLIVGDGSAPIEDAVFLVENNHFAQVGRRDQVEVPAGAQRVDLRGTTVMPAIIDLHTHSGGGTRDDIIERLQRQAYFGVAAILSFRDGGDLPFEIRDTPIHGAALYHTGGPGITAPEPGRSTVPYFVTTETEARAAVQEHAARQVDMIKIWVDDRQGEVEALSPALYGAIIDEANRHGLRVAAHIRYLEDAKELLRAGLHGFAHGVRDREIDEEFVALFMERPEVFLTPNLPPRGVMPDLTWIQDTYPPEAFERILEEARSGSSSQAFALQRPLEPFAIQAANLATLNMAGIRIGFATDSSTGWGAHIELEDMVAAGMTPGEVIVAATSTSAAILGLTDHGTVAPGRSASFIVLDANPLDDITNTRRIARVYLRGTEVDRAALRAQWTGRATE